MKYYTAFGRVIATRVNGVLSYNLADHLGSTVQQIDAANTPGPAIKYFPFGAPRNGTSSPERAFTGQQREDDSPLGMYYYHARFYSSVLGHFMSADSSGDGSNRFAYVRGNPIRLADPSGRTALIACGTGNSCQDGQDIGAWQNLVTREWQREGRFPGASDELYGILFQMLQAALATPGYNGAESAKVFGDVFFDTASGGLRDVLRDIANPDGFLAKVSNFLVANTTYFGPNGANIWAGYSWGGAVVFSALLAASSGGGALPTGAILIEPAIGFAVLPHHVLHEVRVVTIVDPDRSPVNVLGGVHGSILGAFNFTADACGGFLQHCAHGAQQALLVDIARDFPASGGSASSLGIVGAAGLAGVAGGCEPTEGYQFCE